MALLPIGNLQGLHPTNANKYVKLQVELEIFQILNKISFPALSEIFLEDE